MSDCQGSPAHDPSSPQSGERARPPVRGLQGTANRNIELKARLPSLDAARRTAERLANRRLPDQRQCDTYFTTNCGRLKLREVEGQPAYLIWYDRPDHVDSRACDYVLVPVDDPLRLKQALSAAWGTWKTVKKTRQIFVLEHVRIHLDEVADLGCFLEFEAVLGPSSDETESHALLARLREAFHLRDEDLLATSYSEMT